MQKITHLARARKQRARDEKRTISAQTSAGSGLSKAQRLLNASKNDQARKMLDQHALDQEFDHE
jgi:hypothetical protein